MPIAQSNQTCVHIRWMIRRDMPTVLSIEESSFEFAWSEEEFIRCLRQQYVGWLLDWVTVWLGS